MPALWFRDTPPFCEALQLSMAALESVALFCQSPPIPSIIANVWDFECFGVLFLNGVRRAGGRDVPGPRGSITRPERLGAMTA